MLAIYRGFTKHLILFFGLLLMLLLLRIYEYCFFLFLNHNTPSINSILFSINFDTFFVLSLSFITLPLCLISYINKKIVICFYSAILIIALFIQISLTHIFLSSGVLLSSMLFNFSTAELFKIIVSEFSWARFSLWLMYPLFFGIFIWAYKQHLNKWQPGITLQKILLSVYLVSFVILLNNRNNYHKSANYFEGYLDFYFGKNKTLYLIHSFVELYEMEKRDTPLTLQQLEEQLKIFQKINPSQKYTSLEFPLENERIYSNALGPFFKKSTIKPNIVIIVVEGLSSSFSGENCYLGNFTPFLDSLAKKGLYWSHFLSNAEHSYGALPNILGSAPYGINPRGLINTVRDYPGGHHYPKHHTIVELLKQQGYQCRSFLGGELFFDNIGLYMNEIGIKCELDATKFETSKFGKPNSGNNNFIFSWGYNDKDMFEQSFKILDTCTNGSPYLDVYLTLSLHSPFDLCSQQYYDFNYLSKRLKKFNPSLDSISKIIDTKIISAALFTDDALRDFIEGYKKREDFANTIFIITGDHRVDADIPRKSDIDFYHVPLYIYSPLLQKNKTCNSISTHLDILPSLLELLKLNYGLNLNCSQQWMGEGLDTSSSFRNERTFSLSLFNPAYPNIFRNGYLVSNNEVKFIDNKFFSHPVTNEKLIDSMKIILNSYRVLNKYVCEKDKICK